MMRLSLKMNPVFFRLTAIYLLITGCVANSLFTDSIITTDRSDEFDWCWIEEGPYIQAEGNTLKAVNYDYKIMTFEVTNSAYLLYVMETMAQNSIGVNGQQIEGYYAGDTLWSRGTYPYLNLNISRINYVDDLFTIQEGCENHPVEGVSWFGAEAFAAHYGGRLPDESEWDKAAAAMTGFIYPFGNELLPNRANYEDSGDPFDNGTTPVGYYNGQDQNGYQTEDNQSPYGAYDMVGNVAEWTAEIYSTPMETGYCIRGGAWSMGPHHAWTWDKKAEPPAFCAEGIGFRIVWIQNDTSSIPY